jgi:hypothetical protein
LIVIIFPARQYQSPGAIGGGYSDGVEHHS